MKTTVLPYQILPHSVFKVQLPSMTKQRLSFFFATNKCRDLISCSGLLQKDFRKKKTVITILACLQRRKEKSQGKERRATQFSLSHVTSFFFFFFKFLPWQCPLAWHASKKSPLFKGFSIHFSSLTLISKIQWFATFTTAPVPPYHHRGKTPHLWCLLLACVGPQEQSQRIAIASTQQAKLIFHAKER